MFMMQDMALPQKLQRTTLMGMIKGKSLLFWEFMQSWVGYELMKVLWTTANSKERHQ
jgi:hypothetical protein